MGLRLRGRGGGRGRRRGRRKLIGVIGAADHRTAGDMEKTHLPGALAVLRKSLGADVLKYGQMAEGRLEILAQSQDVTTHLPQIEQGGEEFLLGLAQAQHQT